MISVCDRRAGEGEAEQVGSAEGLGGTNGVEASVDKNKVQVASRTYDPRSFMSMVSEVAGERRRAGRLRVGEWRRGVKPVSSCTCSS